MGGAQPPRTSVISPATGPVWAARRMAPFLPTAALPRPWWPLQTRQATGWRALALAREVGVRRIAAGISTGRRVALILLPVSPRDDGLGILACARCTRFMHGACWSWLNCSSVFSSLKLIWLSDWPKTVSSSGDFFQTTSASAESFLYSAFNQLCLHCRCHQLRRLCLR